MIRDEYNKNQSKSSSPTESKKKSSIRDGLEETEKISKRSARKKASMGERNFYAYQVKRLQDLSRAVSFSNNFSLVIFSVLYVLILAVYILLLHSETPYSSVSFIIWSSIYAAFVIWYLVWRFALKAKVAKKAEFYRKELERMSFESLSKVSKAYNFYSQNENSSNNE